MAAMVSSSALHFDTTALITSSGEHFYRCVSIALSNSAGLTIHRLCAITAHEYAFLRIKTAFTHVPTASSQYSL
jgi:hypothetical protein